VEVSDAKLLGYDLLLTGQALIDLELGYVLRIDPHKRFCRHLVPGLCLCPLPPICVTPASQQAVLALEVIESKSLWQADL